MKITSIIHFLQFEPAHLYGIVDLTIGNNARYIGRKYEIDLYFDKILSLLIRASTLLQ